MNSPIHMQLVKWTVPAVAFVIALFWYRRRRIEKAELVRNDPGGDAEYNHEDCAILSDCEDTDADVQEESSQSSISCNCAKEDKVEEPTRVPTKTSESMELSMNTSNLPFNSTMNEHCTNTFTKRFSVPSYELNSTIEQNVFPDNAGEQQTLYYEAQQPSQQQYSKSTTQEYNCEGDSQQASKKHIEDTVNVQRNGYERDSANHSPVSGVLEGTVSPDETRSEGSMDSGKGGSINENRKNNVVPIMYDFAVPLHLVGRLIGRHGSFLHSIRTKTNVSIYVNDHPYDGDHKICSMQGTTEEINAALKIIRQKFPEKKFPQVTLTEISATPVAEVTPIIDPIAYVSNCTALSLIDGINNDVIISHVVKPNWLFVNLPTHPTYPSLQNVESDMYIHYGDPSKPPRPEHILDVLKKGEFVVIQWDHKWTRACIQKVDSTGERHIVRLLDHGGYWTVSSRQMRVLLPQFMLLPFQAIEIFLANIQSKNGIWLQSAYNLVSSISKFGIGQAQVEGYIENNVYTNIYFSFSNFGVFSLADELVAKGYAEPVAWEHLQPENIEGYILEEEA